MAKSFDRNKDIPLRVLEFLPPSPEIVIINIAGEIFQTYDSTLAKYPDSLLGDYRKRKRYLNKRTGELYFDRHSEAFESILYYYQSEGDLYHPSSISLERFINELEFFDIDRSVIEKLEIDNGISEPPVEIKLPKFKPFKYMWEFLEYPDSSYAAKVFAIMSVFVIMLSLSIFVLETVPLFQIKENTTFSSNTTSSYDKNADDIKTPHWMHVINTFVIAWFTIEYILRLITCPSKWTFFTEIGNVIDLLSILPFFLALGASSSSNSRILSVIRVIRVMRVLKLSRHSSSLQVLGRALLAAREELAIICIFVMIKMLLFASLVYYAEEHVPNTNFVSIPDAMWWGIVSLSSTGYGDMSPVTIFGRLTGSFATLCSILVCVLPVPSIVSHFTYFTKMEKNRQNASKRKKAPVQKDANRVSRRETDPKVVQIGDNGDLPDDVFED